MKEIRFLKDLPCKLINSNKSVITLKGGDVYYDKDGNRYAFLTLENTRRSPIFFIELLIKEYDNEGKLIKDETFTIPYMYAPKGEFVNEKPIEIEQETEAVEVLIRKATFDKENFEDDLILPFSAKDYIEKPSNAPKKKNIKPTQTFESEEEEEAAKVDLTTLPRGKYTKKNPILFIIPILIVVVAAIVLTIVNLKYADNTVANFNGWINL